MCHRANVCTWLGFVLTRIGFIVPNRMNYCHSSIVPLSISFITSRPLAPLKLISGLVLADAQNAQFAPQSICALIETIQSRERINTDKCTCLGFSFAGKWPSNN